ncbi:glycosyltransferase family 4 protein [Trinickia caryophylli]|uniref:Glycosyl transferases group 1 n=1 Tax=Trinickia caryophylli TaxID=28094 RepID=A0A1X7EC51_TRICW|nr:glycosyltransferase family 4 protein [Trinickia caryophylli]WQE14550.1 glycosyltransferase family 4 protein [Trinickia caryophylli]GLU32041.1 LPS biosynthesis-related transferase [Trinickia caryophylli]SMF31003.1 Glycosyl transferases group 1 [Trinickia caryophylli]
MRRERRLRVLTWHVHGNYLYYLTQAPHEFWLVTRPGNPPGHAGRTGVLPWGDNVHEVDAADVPAHEFDLVLYQHREHWDKDRLTVLSDAQRRLPRVYLEHDPPQNNAFCERHWVDDENTLLVHVTHFNRLMWDNGGTPTRVIEHGVVVPEGVRYTGELERGVVVINNLASRGRRLGADVFEQVSARVPLDLVGMNSEQAGGLGEVGNLDLAAFTARYRLFFNPIRWTSLGLAIVEAMTIGMPIVGLATTELATVIRNGENGFVATDADALVASMQALLRDPREAKRLGDGARRTALERFAIGRFVDDWCAVLREVTH